MKDCTCDICEQKDDFLSSVIFNANYGSAHDGERLTIALCGDCFDKLFDLVLDMKPWVVGMLERMDNGMKDIKKLYSRKEGNN